MGATRVWSSFVGKGRYKTGRRTEEGLVAAGCDTPVLIGTTTTEPDEEINGGRPSDPPQEEEDRSS